MELGLRETKELGDVVSPEGKQAVIASYWRLSSSNIKNDRIPSTTPGAEPPRDAKDSGSARSHSTHLETSSSNRP